MIGSFSSCGSRSTLRVSGNASSSDRFSAYICLKTRVSMVIDTGSRMCADKPQELRLEFHT